MTATADATISALRSTHDELVAVVRGLTDEQLRDPSGASEWPVAQVLSHLGSGAEIGLATLAAATGEREPLGDGFNQSVWDRWNAMSPREQADGFVDSDGALVAAYEALTPEQRSDLQVKLGFLPMPLPVALARRDAAQRGRAALVGRARRPSTTTRRSPTTRHPWSSSTTRAAWASCSASSARPTRWASPPSWRSATSGSRCR